ncbi:hypothetical protein C0J52_19697 [Blattella germanica]|nr:hypothetical protein C0J52_19697 [Blattella germanica]
MEMVKRKRCCIFKTLPAMIASQCWAGDNDLTNENSGVELYEAIKLMTDENNIIDAKIIIYLIQQKDAVLKELRDKVKILLDQVSSMKSTHQIANEINSGRLTNMPYLAGNFHLLFIFSTQSTFVPSSTPDGNFITSPGMIRPYPSKISEAFRTGKSSARRATKLLKLEAYKITGVKELRQTDPDRMRVTFSINCKPGQYLRQVARELQVQYLLPLGPDYATATKRGIYCSRPGQGRKCKASP